jgi:hypothetical protein
MLKHLHVVSAKSFVVEVLPAPESLPDEALVLWLQHRHPNPAVVGGSVARAGTAADASAHGVWWLAGARVGGCGGEGEWLRVSRAWLRFGCGVEYV